MKWIRLKEVVKRILEETGRCVEVRIHLSTELKAPIRANVQGNDKNGYDILLSALYNKETEDIYKSVAHELGHILGLEVDSRDEIVEELYEEIKKRMDEGK